MAAASRQGLFALLLSGAGAAALGAGGPLPVPLLGWSSWNTFQCDVNDTVVRGSIEWLAASPLFTAGYRWIMIDDGWTACLKFLPDGSCAQPGPRDNTTGRIVVDKRKFPDGFAPLTSLAKSKGIHMGIYTSVSARTCGGYTGSFQNEALDAQTFIDWGFDFIKHDSCGTDYSVHDGGFQAAVIRMRDGIWSAGEGRVVYYLDSGNPTSPQKVFNPRQYHVSNLEYRLKLATSPDELSWNWATRLSLTDQKGPHMVKTWFDIDDDFRSTLTNLHNQIRVAEFQRCGAFLFPDYLTIGQGQQTHAQYEAQFFLWAVLGTPLVLGADIRKLSAEDIALVTSPEVIAIAQDTDCVQGSMARASGGMELWIKPLSDASWAAVVFNTNSKSEDKMTIYWNGDSRWEADFFPAGFDKATVRDVHARKDLGVFQDKFTVTVPATSARIFRIVPTTEVVV